MTKRQRELDLTRRRECDRQEMRPEAGGEICRLWWCCRRRGRRRHIQASLDCLLKEKSHVHQRRRPIRGAGGGRGGSSHWLSAGREDGQTEERRPMADTRHNQPGGWGCGGWRRRRGGDCVYGRVLQLDVKKDSETLHQQSHVESSD